MRPTRAGPLVLGALVGLGLGWAVIRLVEALAGRILGVPWAASLGLWALALGILFWAVISRPTLPGARRRGPAEAVAAPSARPPMPPIVAARTAALAMAASRTGAVVGGFYLGLCLALLGVADTPSGAAALAAAATAVLACVVLIGAAVWLESMCRLRNDDD